MSVPSPLRFAIVGAGIAGCSAAAFVRDQAPDAAVTVFERERDIGGRIETISFHGCTIETGASFFHSSNQLLCEFAASIDLALRERQRLDGSEAHPAGLWDGHHFVMRLRRQRLTSMLYLASRYGWSLVRVRRLCDDVLLKWRRIYALQKGGAVFESPLDLLAAVGLADVARERTYHLLARQQVGRTATADFFNGIFRSIYNQDASINGFAGVVALLGSGITSGRTLSIKNGNIELCRGLLRLARAHVRVTHQVRALVRNGPDDHRPVVLLENGGREGPFDAVIVAVPYAAAAIDMHDCQPDVANESADIRVTHVACVAGRLNARYFGVADDAELPQTILTTETDAIPFTTITRNTAPTAEEHVYKIQSRAALSDDVLRAVFSRVTDVTSKAWAAYPMLPPSPSGPSFRLADRIYYPNAMESIVSTLETEVVAARNVVSLAIGRLQRQEE